MPKTSSDYHLLVAQNFLQNISRTGSHDDTSLRIFGNRGFSIQKADSGETTEFPKSAESSSAVKFDLGSREAHEGLSGIDIEAEYFKTERPDEYEPDEVLPAGKENMFSQSFPVFGGSPNSIGKKNSLLRKFKRIVSNDEMQTRRDVESIPLTSRSCAEKERKMADPCEGHEDNRPGSPLSTSQSGFLNRIRTTFGKCERSYICSKHGLPIVVLSHLAPNVSDRSLMMRSRSTLANSTERIRNLSECSAEDPKEIRPYFGGDSSDENEESTEVCFGHLLGLPATSQTGRTNRRSNDSRRDSNVDDIDIGNTSLEDDVIDVDDNSLEKRNADIPPYEPLIFEEVEMARKTVVTPRGLSFTTLFTTATDLAKAAMNAKFKELFPQSNITYSKFVSLKRDITSLSSHCKLDLITTSFATVYFEKVVIQGSISKSNRRAIAGVSLVVASKLNDYSKERVRGIIDEICDDLKLTKKELLSFELPVCAALSFDLLASSDHVMPHYHRLILEKL